MILPDYDDPITTSNAEDILRYAQLLMMEAALDLEEWSVDLFGGKRALGRCQWSRSRYDGSTKDHEILLSRPWFVTLGLEGMVQHASGDFDQTILEDTIRHEIAHALTLQRYGPKAARSHGRKWKQMARAVHARPTRTEGGLPTRLMASYKRICPNCETVYKWLYQYSERRGTYVCTKCDAPHAESRLTVVKNREKVL